MTRPLANLVDVDAALYSAPIRKEQTLIVCGRLGTLALIEGVFGSAMIAALLWEVVTVPQLAAWLGVNLCVVGWQAGVFVRARATPSPVSLETQLVSCVFALGLFWAILLAYTFFVTPEFLHHLYISVFMGALGVLGLTLFVERPLSFFAFVVPPSAALGLQSLLEGDPKHVGLAALLFLSLPMLGLFARNLYRDNVRSLTQRYSIAALAREAQAQRDNAERANVAKSKFLAAASHDLRQPMHALSLLSAALPDATNIGDVRAIASDIRASVSSLEKMFDSLLDVSRLDAGVLKPVPVHFRLDRLLKRVSGEFAVEALAKGLSVECDVGECVAYSDPILIERIARNYLANAVRYTEQGFIRVEIDPIEPEKNPEWRIAVSDSGIGIPSEQLESIFDEFHQVDNPERDRAKGLGLGLAIVKRIADLLGHRVGVDSTIGRGTRFYVSVPRGKANEIRDESSKWEPTPNLQGLRVVVIDDDVAICDSMRRLLTMWGCRCVCAESADAAAAAAREQLDGVDVLIVDYRLRSHLTGVDAIARMRREFESEIPALIVSGDTAPELLRELAATGHTLVHKPVQPPALRAFLAYTSRTLRAR